MVEFLKNKIETAYDIMGNIEGILSFNPRSNTQLGKALIEDLGLPVVKKTPAGKPSFNKEAMVVYDELLSADHSPLAKLILQFRGGLPSRRCFVSLCWPT